MKYGTLVAFIHAGAIAFGVLIEKVTRENADGETTEYVIEKGDELRTRVAISDESHIKELDPRYPSLMPQYIGSLHDHSAMFECASERAHAIRFPVEPSPVVEAGDPAPAPVPVAANADDHIF